MADFPTTPLFQLFDAPARGNPL